jgi:hypothetical protein
MRATPYSLITEPSDELGTDSQDQTFIPSSTTPGRGSLNCEREPSGRIYFVLCHPEGSVGRIKIGWTAAAHFKTRLAAIKLACPYPTTLLGLVPGDRAHERRIHSLFRDSHRRSGEWFDATDELLAFIDSLNSGGPLPGPQPRISDNGESHPARQELARIVRAVVEPCKAGETISAQQKRAAELLGISVDQAWRMWHGRGSPSLYHQALSRTGGKNDRR